MSFGPLRPGEPDFPAVNPIPTDPQISGYIPPGSISNDKLGFGLDSRKIQGVGIKVYRSTNQTITDATDTAITFNTVVSNKGFATPAATFTTLTAPYSGIYLIVFQVEWAADATNRRQSWITLNGTAAEGDTRNGTASQNTRVPLPAIRRLTAGDSIGTRVRQNSTGSLAVQGGEDNCSLSMVFLFSI